MSEFKTQKEFIDWAANVILTRFVEEGGKGLRGAIVIICNVWDQFKKGE